MEKLLKLVSWHGAVVQIACIIILFGFGWNYLLVSKVEIQIVMGPAKIQCLIRIHGVVWQPLRTWWCFLILLWRLSPHICTLDTNDHLLSGYFYNWDIYSLWLCMKPSYVPLHIWKNFPLQWDATWPKRLHIKNLVGFGMFCLVWFIVSYDSANKQKHHKSHRMQ